MTYRVPVLILPEIYRDASSALDLLTRFNRYGQILNLETIGEVPRLTIITKLDDYDDFLIRQSEMHNISLFRISADVTNFVFYLKVMRIIRNLEFKSLMLIAGDLRFGLLIVLLLPKFLNHGMKKQLAIHGEFITSRHNFSFKYGLKHLVVSFAIKRFDSIRVVSNHLMYQIQQMFKVQPSKIIVAPIPVLQSDGQMPIRDVQRPYSRILVLGRLHSERGIVELLELLDVGLKKFPSLTVTFIGDGPELWRVENWMTNRQLVRRVKLVGKIEHNLVMHSLNQFDILISNSPHEGFGLAIREAALAGLIVVAKSNSGTQELKLSFGASINLFKSREEFQNLLEDILLGKIIPSRVSDLRQKQFNLDKKSLHSLVWSWIRV